MGLVLLQFDRNSLKSIESIEFSVGDFFRENNVKLEDVLYSYMSEIKGKHSCC